MRSGFEPATSRSADRRSPNLANRFRGASDVRYSCCRNRTRVDVGLSVGISFTVSVPSNKVRVVIVLIKNVVKVISLVL